MQKATVPDITVPTSLSTTTTANDCGRAELRVTGSSMERERIPLDLERIRAGVGCSLLESQTIEKPMRKVAWKSIDRQTAASRT